MASKFDYTRIDGKTVKAAEFEELPEKEQSAICALAENTASRVHETTNATGPVSQETRKYMVNLISALYLSLRSERIDEFVEIVTVKDNES